MQFGVALRNARANVIESTISTTPILTIRTGAAPANCAAANSGTVVATVNCPSDWLAAASGGAVAINNGPWQDLTADATGTAAHFRIHDSGGTVCHIQGTVGTAATDMIVDNTSFNAGQQFNITSFTITEGNA
jgi:hypothetical protein